MHRSASGRIAHLAQADGDGAVQQHHGARMDACELAIEGCDLWLVGFLGRRGQFAGPIACCTQIRDVRLPIAAGVVFFELNTPDIGGRRLKYGGGRHAR